MSGPLVLCYHAVSPDWPAALSVTPHALEAQLGTLVRHGYAGARFADAATGSGDGRTVAVTFDDAFLSVFEFARPTLRALDLPGTLFVPSSYIAAGELAWEGIDHWAATEHAAELRCMSWEQIGQLADEGWEIGSHTETHPHLTRLSDDRLATELYSSRAAIADRIGGCETIAYPFGDVDGRVARAAAAAGYRYGAGLGSDLRPRGPLRVPRVGIYHRDEPRRFALKVNPAMRRLRASPLWRR